MGLGLAIVDGLCRVLDHSLELKSKLGCGSTFLVHVPIAVGGETYRPTRPEEASSGLQGLAVLVIDDEPNICLAMSELLKCWDCRVLAAESADEAVARIASEGFFPDMVIADYRLREGCTGTQAIAKVRRALDYPVHAAILTGDTAPERLLEASASGFLILHKPIQPARLRAALTHWREAGYQ